MRVNTYIPCTHFIISAAIRRFISIAVACFACCCLRGWRGSSQWDRCNSKEIESYLFSASAWTYCAKSKRIKIKRPYRETLGRYPTSNLIQHCCKTRMQNEVIDRGWGGIRLVVEATWQDSRQVDVVNDIRSLSSALDQVTDYIVLYNVSRETNNYKHNAWFQTREESYRSLCLQSYHFA